MPLVEMPNGERVPALGQGTWNLGDHADRRAEEIAALQAGIDAGLSVIDTAEAYGDGASERLVGEAIARRRDHVFLVSKVLPPHAVAGQLVTSCEASLSRLGTDRIDLYLLHWLRDGDRICDELFEGFERLVDQGKIRSWGVSNFALSDLLDLDELGWLPQVATDQILYNLRRRAAEGHLLPWCAAHRLPVMAYSPVEGGRMLVHETLAAIAAAHGATPAQVALAWLLHQPGIISIPKAGRLDHVADNRAAVDLELTSDDLALLDAAFPAPPVPSPFEMG